MAATEPVYISYLNYIGSGAPADGDQITRDNSTYPLNCVYTDRETGITYVRKATTKVAATDWQAGGGGATEITVYQRKTVITDDQIKTLPSSYFEIVPAPGVGKQILMIASSLQMKFSNGAYTNVSAPSVIGLSYGDWDAEATVVIVFPNDASNMLNMLPAAIYNSPPTGYTSYMQGAYSDRSTIENKPIKVFVDNQGDFTGGDPANTLEVTVFYSIVDL